jgi:hypothetical protein
LVKGLYSWDGKKAMARCGLSLSKRTTVFHKNELQRNIGCYFLSFKDTTGNESQLEFKWKNEFSLNLCRPEWWCRQSYRHMYEQSLANLDRVLDYEINTVSIKVNGLVKPQIFYLKKDFTSEISKSIKF